jgi:hypothetical protein
MIKSFSKNIEERRADDLFQKNSDKLTLVVDK